MAKRLQVTLKDREYRETQRAARARHMTIAAWVRQALEAARRQQPVGDATTKLAAIRAAVQLNLGPAADLERMLAEIESGYLADSSR
ncbi:MAG: antitoxin [Candidatus Acidiferrales bacterium]